MPAMHYVRGACGAFLIFVGLGMQWLGWCLDQAGYLIECAGSGMAEW